MLQAIAICLQRATKPVSIATESHFLSTDLPAIDAELVLQLERTIRTLNKRVYAPTIRALRSLYHGLDRGSFVVLATLGDAATLRASELAGLVELDLSTVSRHVTYFEQLGLVTREPDPDDRRASRISLTPQGRTALKVIRDARIEILDAVFASWSTTDRIDLQRLLDQLLSDLSATQNQPILAQPAQSMETRT
jgi:DNA-binding MarR family transcriptional regulator